MTIFFIYIGIIFIIYCTFSPIYKSLENIYFVLCNINESLNEILNTNNKNNEHFEKIEYRLERLLEKFEEYVKKKY